MKYARIYTVPNPGRQGSVWKWRASDRRGESSGSFEFYLDCFEDATRNGYAVELEHARGFAAATGPRLASGHA